MFQSVKNLRNFIKSRKNCSPLCPHCEVEVSENTALAISKLLDKRIKELSEENLALIAELRYQKDLVISGAWHDEYDAIMKEEKNVN